MQPLLCSAGTITTNKIFCMPYFQTLTEKQAVQALQAYSVANKAALPISPVGPRVSPEILDKLNSGGVNPAASESVVTPIQTVGPQMPVLPTVENTGIVNPDGVVQHGVSVLGTGIFGWVKANPVPSILIGAGVAFLLMNKGKVSGKGKNLLPVVLVGGGLAAYLLLRKKPVADVPVVDDPYVTDGEYQETVNDQTPSPVIDINPDAAAMIRSQTAKNNEAWMRANYPQYSAYLDRLSDAQINTLYQFLYGYVAQGLKLYRLPNSTGIYPDGGWNTVLYDAVKALPFTETYMNLYLKN